MASPDYGACFFFRSSGLKNGYVVVTLKGLGPTITVFLVPMVTKRLATIFFVDSEAVMSNEDYGAYFFSFCNNEMDNAFSSTVSFYGSMGFCNTERGSAYTQWR